MKAESAPENSFTLEFIAGARAGQTADLSPGKEYILGRGSDADIVIDHKKASRRHARIFPKGENCAIEDLGSINGTLVNGEKISEQVLFPGDSIQIADARIRVRLAGAHPGINEDLDSPPKTVGIFADRDANGEFATMGNAMSGRLDESSPRELLTMMAEAKVTGVLSIHPSWGAGRVLFRKGAIYYARVDGAADIRPAKALQRLVTAKSGSFEFSNEEPPSVEDEISQSLDELLGDIESLGPQFERLERLMHSMDADLVVATNADTDSHSGDRAMILKLVRENSALSWLLDRSPGTDAQAARTIGDLLESGVLTTDR